MKCLKMELCNINWEKWFIMTSKTVKILYLQFSFKSKQPDQSQVHVLGTYFFVCQNEQTFQYLDTFMDKFEKFPPASISENRISQEIC